MRIFIIIIYASWKCVYNRAINNKHESDIIIFADDNTPTTSCKDPKTLERNIQEDGDRVIQWFDKNDTLINK